jgi:mannose-6-phosphate isomerase-like protein (cupin superfamily)
MSLHPVASHAESIPTLDVLGAVTRILLDGKQTRGALGLVEIIAPAGSSIPTHVHSREDETFHVLEGELEFWCGGHTTILRAGDSYFAPHGVPHCPRVSGETPARLLVALTPAGFERAFRDIDELTARGAATTEAVTSLLRTQYGCEFLPPS